MEEETEDVVKRHDYTFGFSRTRDLAFGLFARTMYEIELAQAMY